MASASPKPVFGGPEDVLSRYLVNKEIDGQEAAGFGAAEEKLGKPSTSSSTGTSNPTSLPNDWYKAYFGNYGVPADVQGNLIDILKKYASDPSTAQALSTQYLRSTPWYQTTFPGFSAGVNNGIFTDETGYRSYLNSINNVYNQYLGRHVSGDEVNALLSEGVDPSTVARRFAGQAYINANKNDIQYIDQNFGQGDTTGGMSKDQLTALGNENAGIDTQLGQLQQKILQHAQTIHDKLFQGTSATPSLSLGANGLSSPSLAGTRGTPDIAA